MDPIWKSVELKPQKIKWAYRNIATCYPSQNLFDDIADKDEVSILQEIENQTSGIDHLQPQKKRVFQYFDTSSTLFVFQNSPFWGGRFSDGHFGVWYGALEEDTSIQEAMYWMSRFIAPDLVNTQNPITVDRRMFRVMLEHALTADFRAIAKSYPMLTDPDDYGFCRELGRHAVENSVGFFLTPSVRRSGGVCSPVFEPSAILDEKTIYYLRFTFSEGQMPVWTRSADANAAQT